MSMIGAGDRGHVWGQCFVSMIGAGRGHHFVSVMGAGGRLLFCINDRGR